MKQYFLIAFLSVAQMLAAKTWYVAPNGNDNHAGTLAAPFKNLTAAIEAAEPGDEIQLRSGTYQSNEIRVTKSNLTIKSYPGEWAKIVCPTNIEDASSCIWYNEPEVTGGRLENLEIIGGYYYGIKFETNWDWGVPLNERRGVKDIVVIGCKIHDTGRDCIKITPACDNLQFINCEIYNSGVGPSNLPANGGPNAEGIDNVNGSHMLVRNCYIHHTSTTGVYAKGGARDCIIESNLVMETGEAGILLGFYTDAEYFDETTNPNFYENINGIARNNIVVNTGGAGIGFFGAKGAKAYHNTVVTASPLYHAPLFCNTAEVWINDNLTLYPPNVDIQVFNNIFVDKSGTGDEDFTAQIREGALSGNNLFDKNIYFKTTGAAIFDDGVSWPALTFSQWKSQLGIDANSQVIDPKLTAQFHLTANSPAIDAGKVFAGLQLRDYDGADRAGIYDIGADEYNVGPSLTVPPPAGTIGTGAGSGLTAIKDLDQQSLITIYPNPATDYVTLTNTNAPAVLTLFDMAGNQLKTAISTRLDLRGLAAGAYFLTIEIGGKTQVQPLLIVR